MLSYAEYERVRTVVRKRVEIDTRTPDLLLAGVSPFAFQEARAWKMPPRRVDWDWVNLTKRKSGGDLELVIWHDQTLCGLAYGRARKEWLELGYIEGNPNGHPLKGRVAEIALAVLRTQGDMLGLPTRLRDPFIELHDFYRDRGYGTLVEEQGTVYLCP